MKTIKKELIWFLIPTFIITYGLGLIAYLKGGMEHFPLGKISMFIPAVIAIILYLFKIKKPIFRNNDLGIKFKGFKYWIIAPLFITSLVCLSYLIPFFIDNNFFKSTEQIFTETQKSGFGVGHWFVNLIVIFGINTLLAPLLNIFMMLGEELGWRAFMTPRLLKLYNPKTAFLIGGAIWALWHGVGILMGLNYPGHPILGNIMMIAMSIPLGIIFQYFYFKSKSIFVPALAHGALNWSGNTFIMFVLSDENYNTLLYGPTGVIGIIILSIVAYFLFIRIDWQKENTYYCK